MSKFEHQRLDGAVFRDCSVANATFDDANLAGANFTNVNLKGAKFSNVNLSGVTIEDANIEGLKIFGHDIAALIRDAGSKSNADTAKLGGVCPILQVPDMATALDFYRDILGFKVVWEFAGPPIRAGLCRDDIGVNLVAPGKTKLAPEIYFYTDNVDALYESVIARGAKIVVPIGDRFYGMRDFRITDPGGNDLSFGQTVGE